MTHLRSIEGLLIMRIFLDTEFIENGDVHSILPISIGIVQDGGEEYYAEFEGVNWDLANDWVIENVRPYLIGETKSKSQIAYEIKEFVGEQPEFWAYCADYDWVLLCQLYGRMVDRPQTWPTFCLDIKQFMWHFGVSKEDLQGVINEQDHNALADARWNREVFKWLLNFKVTQGL